MAWELKIHTIDVKQGDCSIIEAWDRDVAAYQQINPNTNPTEIALKRFALEHGRYQAVLIDGGQLSQENVVVIRDYIIGKEIGITKIVLTHFDADHYLGLTNLLDLDDLAMALYRTDCCLRIFNRFESVFTELIPVTTANYEMKRKIIKGILIYNNVLFGSTSKGTSYGGLVINYDDDIQNKEPILRELIGLILENIIDSETINIDYTIGIIKILNHVDASPDHLFILKDINIYDRKTLRNGENNIDGNTIFKSEIKTIIKPPILTNLTKIIIQERVKITVQGKDEFLCKVKQYKMFNYYGGIIGFNPKVWKVTNSKRPVPPPVPPVPPPPNTFYLGEDLLWENNNVTFGNKTTTNSYEKRPYLFIVNCGQAFTLTGDVAMTATNASSIGLFLIFDEFTFLTAGDLEDSSAFPNEDYETRLAVSLKNLGYNRITGMKCGHHGGENATNDTVLEALNPKFAIISCGTGMHGHPRENTLFRLDKHKSVQYVFLTNCMQRYGVKRSYERESTHSSYEETKLETIYENVYESFLLSDGIDCLKDKFNTPEDFEEWIKRSIKEEVLNSFNMNNFMITSYNFNNGEFAFLNYQSLEWYARWSVINPNDSYSNYRRQTAKTYIAGGNKKCLEEQEQNGNYVFEIAYNQANNQYCEVYFYVKKNYILQLQTIPISLINYPFLNERHIQNTSFNAASLPAPFDIAFQYFLEFLPDKNIVNIDDKIQPIDNVLTIDYTYQDKEWLWQIDDIRYLDISINKFQLKITNDLIVQKVNIESSLLAQITKHGASSKIITFMADFNSKEYQPYWKFYPQSTDITKNFNFLDLFNIILEDDSLLFIPDDLKFITTINEKLSIKEFYLKVYPNEDIRTQCHIEVEYECNLEIIPQNKLVLTKIGINADLTSNSYSTLLYGDFQIKEKNLEIGIGMATNEYWYGYIKGKTTEGQDGPLPSLIDMANWLGGFNETELENNLKSISSDFKFDLTDIRIELNMKTKAVRFLAVDSILKIKSLSFNIATTLLPDLRVYGRLDTTTTTSVNIKKVLKDDFSLDSPFQSEMTITEASIDAYPKGEFYKINLGVGDVAKINIGGGKELDINEIDLQVESNSGNFSGYLDAILVVKPAPEVDGDDEADEPIAFELRAAYENEHWVFDGQLNGDIELEEFITWLTNEFDISKDSLPKWLLNLHLTHVEIGFSTAGYFNFDMELYSPLSSGDAQNDETADKEERLTIQFSIIKNIDNAELIFDASVDISGEIFEIIIAKDKTSTNFDATWRAEAEHYLQLEDIIDGLQLSDAVAVPADVNLDLNTATIYFSSEEIKAKTDSEPAQYQKTLMLSASSAKGFSLAFIATKVSGKWIYAFNVGIEKIKIDLSKAPLVGSTIGDKIKVENVQLLLLSAALSKMDVQKLNQQIKGETNKFEEPENDTDKIPKGVFFKMDLYLGDKKIPLNVGTSKKAKNQEDKQNNAVKLWSAEAEADDLSNAPAITWKKIGKKVGPIQLNRAGVSFAEAKLSLHLDADLIVGPMTIGLEDLSITSPINEFNISAGLNGLSLSYITNVVQIGGGLKKAAQTNVKYQYDGVLVLGLKAFSLSAVGSYAELNTGETSMFLFAMLTNPPLGGPPAFYVTGIAAGFGYNRNLLLPAIEDVRDFPLVSPFVRNDSALENQKKNPIAALELLGSFVPIEVGQQWLAAGVRFRSYEILETVALLAVKFGTELEIALLGVSTLQFPKGVKPLVNAQLALSARIQPSQGIISVNALLTSESYLFDPNCKLRGGFALYMWMNPSPYSGDFVVTLGGYSSKYTKPDHYPTVPRLGLYWKLSDNLNISGEMYYALTPSCIMAGGRLAAIFQSGNFKAWFEMGLDLMITWQPFHYEASMYINFGVSYTFELDLYVKTITKTISASFGATLEIWGPDFSGTAEIELSIVSFRINFGSARSTPKSIDWNDFTAAFLPKQSNSNDIIISNYASTKVISGLIPTSDDKPILVQQDNIVFECSTLIPAKTLAVSLAQDNYEMDSKDKEIAFGNKLCGLTANNFNSDLTIYIYKKVGNDYEKITDTNFRISEQLSNLPSAQWAKDKQSNSENVLKNVLTGVKIEPFTKDKPGITVKKKDLEFADVNPKIVNLIRGKNSVLGNQIDIKQEMINAGNKQQGLADWFEKADLIENTTISLTRTKEGKNYLKAKPRSVTWE